MKQFENILRNKGSHSSQRLKIVEFFDTRRYKKILIEEIHNLAFGMRSDREEYSKGFIDALCQISSIIRGEK